MEGKLPTQEQIVQRMEERKSSDPMEFEHMEYIDYLDYEHAKPHLKEGTTKADWEKSREKLTTESILNRMLKYMEFAWGKANDCRGISANRSIMHFIAWTWLAGYHELSEKIDSEFNHNYCHYGKPILIMICEHYGWNHKKWDNGVRTNNG